MPTKYFSLRLKMKKYFFLSSLFLCLFLILFGCQRKTAILSPPSRPTVVVSVFPYVSLVKALGGETIHVVSAISKNFDPHTNEPLPSQIKTLQNCSLWIGIGEPYEKKILSLLSRSSQETMILELNKQIPLLDYHDATYLPPCSIKHSKHLNMQDPHFWLSPKRLTLQAHQIAKALINLNPDKALFYKNNLKKYVKEVERLDAYVSEKLKPFEKKALIVSHPFLGYLCHDYHLTQIALECEGKSPRLADFNTLLALIKKSDIIAVFTAPQFDNRAATLIAEKMHFPIYQIDPVGGSPFEIIESLVKDITHEK